VPEEGVANQKVIVAADPGRIADELWRRYRRAEL